VLEPLLVLGFHVLPFRDAHLRAVSMLCDKVCSGTCQRHIMTMGGTMASAATTAQILAVWSSAMRPATQIAMTHALATTNLTD
jgi:hypothetical protein